MTPIGNPQGIGKVYFFITSSKVGFEEVAGEKCCKLAATSTLLGKWFRIIPWSLPNKAYLQQLPPPILLAIFALHDLLQIHFHRKLKSLINTAQQRGVDARQI